MKFCDKPIKQTQNQNQFTGVVQNAEEANDRKDDDSFEVFACWNDTIERSTEASQEHSVEAIVDTGVTKTVIGDAVFENITSNQKKELKTEILQDRNNNEETMKFKFGDSRTVIFETIVHLPVQLTDKVFKLKAHVLPGKVPFLIGIETVRRMRGNIDILNSTVELLGVKLKRKINNMGHMVLKLSVAEGKHDGRSIPVFHLAKENGVKERMKGLLKRLHVKFGHASINKLARVVEHSSMKKDMTKTELRQMIGKIYDECEICAESKIAQRDQRTAL